MTIELPTPDAVECRELRTYQSKTFRLPCGSLQCEVRKDAVCYTSDEGVLRSCDTTIKQSDGRIFVEWLPYKFELHNSGVGFDFQSRDSGFVRLMLTGIGGDTFNVNDTLKPVVVANEITFVEVSPGVDIIFRILPNRVKTLRIIKNSDAARTFEWLCEYDASGRDKVDDTLIGLDAGGNSLDLNLSLAQVTESSSRILESWSGKTVIRAPDTRIKSLSDEVLYPVEIDPTVSYNVGLDVNDGYQVYNASNPSAYPQWFSGNSTVAFGKNATGEYDPGWSFPSVNVPQGATISAATLTITATNGISATGTLFGSAANNATAFSASYRPRNVTRTTASAAVTVTGNATNSWSVAAQIQEIVNRAGWAANNRLNLIGIGSGSAKAALRDYNTNAAQSGNLSITYTLPVSAAITGTAVAGITESDIVAGGKTIIITLTNDTWVASGATFDAQRQAIINGIDSAQAESTGWDAVVKATQGVSGVVRTSSTVVTITLSAQASYNISATETITVTVPSSALTGNGGAVVASPAFTVTEASSGFSILGSIRPTNILGM